jgi:wyosine [tRNA(Phe)-imidazoG37] synthetase (radical SAM superfamily)
MNEQEREFYKPDQIYNIVEKKVNHLKGINEKIDYISFVPDGEPTLDINLGATLEKVKTFSIKIAVITNATLISDLSVQNDLMKSDLVSLKVDSVNQKNWRKINRPHGSLNLECIKENILKFASVFRGTLLTETMLVDGYNDSDGSLNETISFINEINPEKAHILIPTRPPTEQIKAPDKQSQVTIKQILRNFNCNYEFTDYYEGSEFTISDREEELLSIISVHPMRKDEVENLFSKTNTNRNLIDDLILKDKIKEIQYNGKTYLKTNQRRNYA